MAVKAVLNWPGKKCYQFIAGILTPVERKNLNLLTHTRLALFSAWLQFILYYFRYAYSM